ncbi:unnamed protein product [Trypanosoma congolense IL3000]|uniref:WGS project CAEQ00000000 data, annotated contig 705 n=1 Tax=Trypanosoma congolense (strain IL3000) TaxID=1068625 RepID=F9WHY4_TRYCI|nr:unnamed protein product [Trypanosoma congolense IL3000]
MRAPEMARREDEQRMQTDKQKEQTKAVGPVPPGFPCPHPLCKKTHAFHEEMNDHIRDDHEDKQKPGVDFMMFVCPFCLSHCETYKRMIEHMQHDHEDEEDNHPDSAGMKCRYCEERFRSYGDVVKHIEKDHSGEPALDDDMVVQSMQFKCYHCEKTCASYRGLGEHIGEVHWNKRPPQPYANDEGMWAPCLHPLCEQEFPSYEEVERHIQDDHLNWGKPGVDFMMFVCPFCLSHCETYKRMIEHMQHDHEDEEDNHPDSAGMKCRYCEERFRSYGDVVKHIEKDHSGEPALDDDMVVQSMQFKCYHCEKTCASYR